MIEVSSAAFKLIALFVISFDVLVALYSYK